MKRVLIAATVMALASLSAGCGLKGKLERPAPLWGSAKETYLQQQKQEAAAKKAAKEDGRTKVAVPVAASAPTPSQEEMNQSQGALPPVQDMQSSNPRY